jgi:glycerol-3-phosphate dehydrogenase
MNEQQENPGHGAYDIVIIGAGIHGAATAYHLSRSGADVLLLDQGDFCSATSANSLKIIHGGLRYLQHLHVRRMRESVSSRRWFMKNFPDVVAPLRCTMPTRGLGMRSRAAMAAALFLNNIISSDQNRGLTAGQKLGRGHVRSGRRGRELFPGMPDDAVTGAAVWYDALALNTERIVFSLINAARDNGMTALNYHLAEELRPGNGKSDFHGIVCSHGLTGEKKEIKTRCILNMTGPWLDQFPFLEKGIGETCRGFARALNIVVRKKLFDGYAAGLEGSVEYRDSDAVLQKGARLFFFVPWRGYTMIGTVYSVHRGGGKIFMPERQDIDSFVAEVNRIYPPADLALDDVTHYHAGLVPLVRPEEAQGFDVQLDKHESVIDHGVTDGIENIFSLKSVKYTTARSVACSFVKILGERGIIPVGSCGAVGDLPEKEDDRKDMVGTAHLRSRYGRDLVRVNRYVSRPGLRDLSLPGFPLHEGEIHYAVREEMAIRLGDLLFRRTDLATAECPPVPLIRTCAGIMGDLLGWDQERCSKEIDLVLQRFKPLSPPDLNGE